jgi:hypothetical protein
MFHRPLVLLALFVLVSSVIGDDKPKPATDEKPKVMTLDPKDYSTDNPKELAKSLKKYEGHPIRFTGELSSCYEDEKRQVYFFSASARYRQERGELEPVDVSTRAVYFYLSGDSRPLRKELSEADQKGATIHVTIECESWECRNPPTRQLLLPLPHSINPVIFEKAKIVTKRVELPKPKPGEVVPILLPIPAAPPAPPTAPEPTPAEAAFKKLVDELPKLIDKAECDPDQSKLKEWGACTIVKVARLTGTETAKIDLVYGSYDPKEKRETAHGRCSLYLTWHRNAWSVVRFDGTKGVVEKDGHYRDRSVALCFAIDEFAGTKPDAPK